MFLTFSI